VNFGVVPFRGPDAMDMKSAPGTLFTLTPGATIGLYAGQRYIPQACYLFLRAMSGGALTTSPGLRLGTNANHNNLCPIWIPPTSLVVNQIGSMPFAAPLIAPPIDGSDLILELTQAAGGPAIMTADILLVGLLVG
jgi:hypothetical protein